MFGAINSLFSGFALAGIVYAILLQRIELSLQRDELQLSRDQLVRSADAQENDYELGQVKFLIDLTPEFLKNNRRYSNTWKVLRQYNEIPNQMLKAEWDKVEDALEQCYQSVLFLHQLSLLITKNIINSELLYLLHYEHIVEHPSGKLRFLKEWCGTGIDLAANYSISELVPMVKSVKVLIEQMSEHHIQHGGEPYDHQLKSIIAMEKELSDNHNKYKIGSKYYDRRYIDLVD